MSLLNPHESTADISDIPSQNPEKEAPLPPQGELTHGTTPRTIDPKDLSEDEDINLSEGLLPPPHIPILKEKEHSPESQL